MGSAQNYAIASYPERGVIFSQSPTPKATSNLVVVVVVLLLVMLLLRTAPY